MRKNGNKKSKKAAENTHVESENAAVHAKNAAVQPGNAAENTPVKAQNAAVEAQNVDVHPENVVTAKENILATTPKRVTWSRLAILLGEGKYIAKSISAKQAGYNSTKTKEEGYKFTK